jgi:two-component system chemotaxis response regulator CheB
MTHPPAEICCIGVSTGGPSALYDIWHLFPRNFPLPVVIVQHMPAMFTQMLAERLDSVGSLPVVEGREGMMLLPGRAVIAPGGFHMRVARQGRELVVTLDEGPKENSCRPAVDALFRSIVEVLGGRAIAAVLTGMGQDGLIGAQMLRAKGAVIIAQDEATSVVWGMPGAVVAAKAADIVLPLDKIVPEILKIIRYR